MAVKDGVYAQVAGTVSRVFSTQKGQALVVEVKPEGSQYADRVTVWGVDFEAQQGDRVAVKGWLSWKRTVKDDKTYFDVSLNRPQLVEREAAPAADRTDTWSTAQPGSPWPEGGGY